MGLSDIIKSAIRTAKNATTDLRMPVAHYPIIGRTGSGPRHAAAPTSESALVEDGASDTRDEAGNTVTSDAKLTFFEPIAVKVGDKYILPDGRDLRVVRHRWLYDPDARPYMTEVWLGE